MSSAVPDGWITTNLDLVTKTVFSNVDKKSYADETPVLLCNYMDVYGNSYITKSIEFMPATAKQREIDKFSLEYDDVMITKDSETPQDIAVPAYVSEQLEGVLCGYHLALIRTDKQKLIGEFLSHLLSLDSIQRRFYRLANGSTRFGLTAESINKAELTIPPLPEQKKIASILTSVDEVIENTQKQIDKLQDLKKATMNELLTKGIGHTEFKDSELGRIPKSWEVYALSEIGTFSKGRGISKKETLLEGVPCLRYAEIYTVYDFYIKTFKSFISPITAESSRKLIKNEIIFAGSGETVEDIGKSVAFTLDCDAYVGGDSVVFSPRSGLDSIFLSYQLNDNIRRRMLRKLGQGSSVIHIYSSGLQEVLVSLPPLSEQKKIASILISMGEAIEEKLEESRKLQSLKKSLMQDLLTGKVRVMVN